MGKPKGLPKTGGRKAGTPNKSSLHIDDLVETYQVDIIKELLGSLNELRPVEKAGVILKLMEYVYPKKKSLETSVDVQSSARPESHDLSQLTDTELRLFSGLMNKIKTPASGEDF